MSEAAHKLETVGLDLHYGSFHALKGVSIAIRPRSITAIIGPSGCGKSTLLRCFNRMNDLIKGVRTGGCILLDGQDIFTSGLRLTRLRKRVGMVFQRPNPFPLSVFENVAYGRRVHGMKAMAAADGETQANCGTGILPVADTDGTAVRHMGETPMPRKKGELERAVEYSLRATGLWDTLKDRLHEPALDLSPEQQQRLCISRVVAVEPEVLLMDEPCSALDPVATEHIEELMRQLADRYTIVIVTHNMQQAARVSRETGFMLLGELVEFGPTQSIFTAPSDKRTEDYVTGRYG